MLEALHKLQSDFTKELQEVNDLTALQNLEVKFLGRKGELTQILRQLASLNEEAKKNFGKAANELKQQMLADLQSKEQSLKNKLAVSGAELDVTQPVAARETGNIHPLMKLQYEVEDIMSQMGFMVATGPELESEYYNFEALNIPATHPARDMQDTFWLEDENLLRTHTSPVQVRTMLKYGAPLKMICPGKVFRYEAMDASHSHTFHQIEGLMLGEDVSIANLKAVMRELLTRLFGQEVEVRLRPGYFSFVEPGMELDFSCLLCGGKGCRVCKHTGWVEFMGCGMVHPNVLKAGKIDLNKYQGFAFGFGLDRLAMMRWGIDDIRLFYEGDLRFIKQF